jgi:type III restriction enzyme
VVQGHPRHPEHVGVKAVYDLSATPFYLGGSGYKEGYIFPWTVSDFSLMDAIESGIVKAPRIPVDDDTTVDTVTFRSLWELVGKDLPKRARAQTNVTSWVMPAELESALHSLYRSYEKAYEHWHQALAPLDEPPPVFIVVCPNTAVSKLVHDWIAGTEITSDDGSSITLQVICRSSSTPTPSRRPAIPSHARSSSTPPSWSPARR